MQLGWPGPAGRCAAFDADCALLTPVPAACPLPALCLPGNSTETDEGYYIFGGALITIGGELGPNATFEEPLTEILLPGNTSVPRGTNAFQARRAGAWPWAAALLPLAGGQGRAAAGQEGRAADLPLLLHRCCRSTAPLGWPWATW